MGWLTVDRASVEYLGAAPRLHRSSASVERGFCGVCGSPLTYWSERRPAEIDLTLGSLDAPDGVRPVDHVWMADAPAWDRPRDGLPQHASTRPPTPANDATSVIREILDGLTAVEKTLPSKLLYDAAGSELFRRITELPEYYLTRTETRLLHEHAPALVAAMPAATPRGRALVEFGAGDEAKALSLLDTVAGRFFGYVAIDIDPSVLEPIRTRLGATHPHLRVETLVADFMQPMALSETLEDLQAVGFLPGSTIGQYTPATVVEFLDATRHSLAGAASPAFVIGTDQCRDPARVLPAYNDRGGLSAAFNLNMLAHINRVADGNLRPDCFRHEAFWNAREERVDICLESRLEHTACIAGRTIHFCAGERIGTGFSYKYSKDRFIALAAAAGWRSAGLWEDSERLFAVHLLTLR